MALGTTATGRVVRITCNHIINTPTDVSFSVSSWIQLHLGAVVAPLGLPSDWTVALDGVETLNTTTTGTITTYEVRVFLALT